MSYYQAKASAVINAPPEKVYEIIADYHQGHPAILPTRYFTKLTVHEGGHGTGTAFTVHMNVFGVKAVYNMRVTETEPGRLLVEEDETAGVKTSFLLEPVDGGRRTQVTIHTKAKTSPGLKGVIEKLLNPAISRKVYREELDQLAEFVSKK